MFEDTRTNMGRFRRWWEARRQRTSRDFRTRRVKLPPEAFAFAEGPDLPPSDLVDEHSWNGITNLPDDVSLRTGDDHGTDLKRAYDAWGDWVSLALALQYLDGPEPTTEAPSVVASFVATDEFQSSLIQRSAVSTVQVSVICA